MINYNSINIETVIINCVYEEHTADRNQFDWKNH